MLGACHIQPSPADCLTRVQAASQKLYLAMLLRDNPLITEAIVTSCKGAKFFDVFVPAIGSEHRIHVGDIRPGPLEVSWNVVPRYVKLPVKLPAEPACVRHSDLDMQLLAMHMLEQ